MKTSSAEYRIAAIGQPRGRKRKLKSVSDILKEAYRRCVRDRTTRTAVRQCLGA